MIKFRGVTHKRSERFYWFCHSHFSSIIKANVEKIIVFLCVILKLSRKSPSKLCACMIKFRGVTHKRSERFYWFCHSHFSSINIANVEKIIVFLCVILKLSRKSPSKLCACMIKFRGVTHKRSERFYWFCDSHFSSINIANVEKIIVFLCVILKLSRKSPSKLCACMITFRGVTHKRSERFYWFCDSHFSSINKANVEKIIVFLCVILKLSRKSPSKLCACMIKFRGVTHKRSERFYWFCHSHFSSINIANV